MTTVCSKLKEKWSGPNGTWVRLHIAGGDEELTAPPDKNASQFWMTASTQLSHGCCGQKFAEQFELVHG